MVGGRMTAPLGKPVSFFAREGVLKGIGARPSGGRLAQNPSGFEE